MGTTFTGMCDHPTQHIAPTSTTHCSNINNALLQHQQRIAPTSTTHCSSASDSRSALACSHFGLALRDHWLALRAHLLALRARWALAGRSLTNQHATSPPPQESLLPRSQHWQERTTQTTATETRSGWQSERSSCQSLSTMLPPSGSRRKS